MVKFTYLCFFVVACACLLVITNYVNQFSAAEEAKMMTTAKYTVKVITTASWKEFKLELEKTYIENGYSFTTCGYLGCDTEYQYAVDRASTVFRLRKELVPSGELFQVVLKQRRRFNDFLALGDLDLPWVDNKHSDAFRRWRKELHLDKSLYDQAERICRKTDKERKGNGERKGGKTIFW